MDLSYLPIIILGSVTILCGIGFFLLFRLPVIKKIPELYKQLFIGVIFGIIAVLNTEFGSDIGGAVINVRDAAPLTAGLIFGAPAGIIAGVIGGVHRFFASFWGVGTYTQIACSVSTILAGLIAAGLRKWMFENRAPNWAFGIVIAIVMESIHLFLIFITHISHPYECLDIVRIITFPIILSNVIVLFAITLFTTIFNYIADNERANLRTINRRIQFWLLLLVMSAAGASNTFLSIIQHNFGEETASSVLTKNLVDIETIIFGYTNDVMNQYVEFCQTILNENPSYTCTELKNKIETVYTEDIIDNAKVSYISRSGIVKDSSDPNYIGFNVKNNSRTDNFHYVMDLMEDKPYSEPFYTNPSLKKSMLKDGGGNFADAVIEAKGYDGYFVLTLPPDAISLQTISSILNQTFKNRRVYANGFSALFDYKGNLIAGFDGYTPDELLISIQSLDEKEEYEINVGKVYKDESDDYHYMYCISETYYILVLFPSTDLANSTDATLYLYNFISVIVYAAIFVITYLLIEVVVVRNIHKINNVLKLIREGDLNQKVTVKSTVEFDALSSDINVAVDTLKGFIEREAKRIDEELSFARKIQSSSLPNVFPPFPGITAFDIYATMNPAKQVGGDFYDFYILSPSTVAFLVADVSGKGIPASMFMMESKTMLKNFATMGHEVANIFYQANNDLCSGNDANMFVTCWMGILDYNTGVVTYSNAGHNYPIIYSKKTNKWSYLKQKKNMVLAGIADIEYQTETFKLEVGDRIFLYTDGVTEATRNDKVLYGEKRLLDFLNAHKDLDQKELLKELKKDIDIFVGGADQFDDITMLILDYKGN